MVCIVSIQEREHAHQQGVMDAFDDAINNRVSHLLDGDYNPKIKENIFEAIGALSEGNQEILATMVNHSACTLSVMLKGWVSDYWEEAAEQKAIKEMSL